jgi:hypothetical protein
MTVTYAGTVTGTPWSNTKVHRSQVSSSLYRNYVAFSGDSSTSGLIRFDENFVIYYKRYWLQA